MIRDNDAYLECVAEEHQELFDLQHHLPLLALGLVGLKNTRHFNKCSQVIEDVNRNVNHKALKGKTDV